MNEAERDRQVEEISLGLGDLLVGKDMFLTIVACLSTAATTAHLIGMPKLELQKMLMRCYDKRIAEQASKAQ